MLRLISFAFIAVFSLDICAVEASQTALNDEEIIQFLIGTIVVPRDSSDYGRSPRAKEVFHKDGTYKVILIDKNCQTLKEAAHVRWNVKNRILTSILEDGTVLRDEVLTIDRDVITLRSLDDGETYTRKKVENC